MKIHTYASLGDIAGVRAELAKGVAVDSEDEGEFTPLAYAASKPTAQADMLRLLIESGADVNAPVKGEVEAQFPVGLAACSGSLTKVQILVDAGADITFVSPGGYTILINVMYPLHDDEQLVPMIKLLVAHGAETDCETEYSESPLSVSSYFGRFDAVKVLLDAGANPARLQWTELMAAIAFGTTNDVIQLVGVKSSLAVRDRWERTPWLIASVAGDIEKAKLIRAAGANADDKERGGATAIAICASRGNSEMLSWLIEIGADIEAVDDAANTPLMIAAQMGRTECARLLLESGANASRKNEYDESTMSMASNEEIVRLLCAAGQDMLDLSTEMKRIFTGLDGDEQLSVSNAEYASGCRPRFGRSNPEVMKIPLWNEMVRAGISAYQGKAQFSDESNMTEATWCFARFGMSFTELPDGRFVQIGGEHEDHYDPDFCIYNDVTVHERSGNFQIMGYPQEVFPPTDFHSATYIDGFIYIIGGLGYQDSRRFGITPIYRLDCTTWQIEAVEADGDNPGWIYEHKAHVSDPNVIRISGGKVCQLVDGEEQHLDNTDGFLLDLSDMIWNRSPLTMQGS